LKKYLKKRKINLEELKEGKKKSLKRDLKNIIIIIEKL
jgi:hypothetical protein